MIDIGLYFGYALFLVALLLTIVLPLIGALKSPKGVARFSMMALILLVLFFVSYFIADNEVTAAYISQGIEASSSQLIGAALIMFYVLFFGGLLGILVSEINKAIK